MLKKIKAFAAKEAVLCISAVLTIISAFFVPPSAEYLGYIDWRVLCLLFCLMAVTSGLESCGFFSRTACLLVKKAPNLRVLSLFLVLLPFFSSMVVTNDVALIIFVPLALMIAGSVTTPANTIKLVVLQTAAANLGSMATPLGNPQNLFLYTNYSLSPIDFFKVVLPIALISLVLICLSVLLIGNRSTEIELPVGAPAADKKRQYLFFGLLILSLLSVFRVINYFVLLGITVILLLIFARDIFKKIDYCLLLTFVCFFIFAKNMGHIDIVRSFCEELMVKYPLITPIAASQVISNVPAAVLLAPFTNNSAALLAGTNIGGLGTPVASLASLISLKLYMKSENADSKKYLLFFTAVNVVFLIILILFAEAVMGGY